MVEVAGGQRERAARARPGQGLGPWYRGARGGREQPSLRGSRQTGQVHGADSGPVRAVGRVVPGDRAAGAGEPQPARRGGGDGPGAPGDVAGEVVLHPDAMTGRDEHGRVRRPGPGAGFDDDPGLGPRLQPGRAGPARQGQRGHPGGDAAVPGEWPVREVEAVAHRLAARPDRRGAALTHHHRRARADLAAALAVVEQRDPDRDQDGDDHADDPAADGTELDPLSSEHRCKATATYWRSANWGCPGGRHGATSARYSTSSLVSSR